MKPLLRRLGCAVWVVLLASTFSAFGQTRQGGTIRGTVILRETGETLHNASVHIVKLRRTTNTDDNGVFEFTNVPPGTYDVLVHLDRFPDIVLKIDVTSGGVAEAAFEMGLTKISEEVTVTATGQEQSTFDSFQAVDTLSSVELAQKAAPSLGEVLDNQPGVAKRSFGPGTSRPVLRGFDGDRVLVLQDGAPTGSVSSQSGDHGETVDVTAVDKIEIVKGPATLLYGSNAVGGVVNVISGHFTIHDHPHDGIRGFVTASGGTNNDLGGLSGGFEYGYKNWLLWGGGGGIRTGDYKTQLGPVLNSKSRTADANVGLGYFGEHAFMSLGYNVEDSRYGVPFAGTFEGGGEEESDAAPEAIDLTLRRHNVRFATGASDLGGFVSGIRVALNYSDYTHQELEGENIGTTFDNNIFSYRVAFDQRQNGRFSGSFGVQGLHRDYKTTGEESLSPPVNQDAFAAFALEEIDVPRARLQFGARIERTSYDPDDLTSRSFTGFSGAAGIHVPLWEGGAFVANYTSSYRAPALEELYNFGPHIGNLTFEVGNQNLKNERSNGLDLSLRHQYKRVQAFANLYYYRINDFVYLAPTGAIKDSLVEARYSQNDARYVGSEIGLTVDANDFVTLNLGLDAVNAKLVDSSTPLPRIPPLRGRAAVDFHYKGFTASPEVILSHAQNDVFPTETRTAGYSVFNVSASYGFSQQHAAHVISVTAFNLGDRLYRNHLSFIKELAPEIGRGVKATYTVRFF